MRPSGPTYSMCAALTYSPPAIASSSAYGAARARRRFTCLCSLLLQLGGKLVHRGELAVEEPLRLLGRDEAVAQREAFLQERVELGVSRGRGDRVGKHRDALWVGARAHH